MRGEGAGSRRRIFLCYDPGRESITERDDGRAYLETLSRPIKSGDAQAELRFRRAFRASVICQIPLLGKPARNLFPDWRLGRVNRPAPCAQAALD
jgi:hypothetical protein